MDTAWFAVDEDGNLAEFHAGDEGSVPVEWIVDHGEGTEIWNAWRKGTQPFDQTDCQRAYWFGVDDDCKWGVYKRTHIPRRPLRLQDLPQPVMEALKPIVLDSIAFDRTLWVQPVEFLRCHTYWGFGRERRVVGPVTTTGFDPFRSFAILESNGEIISAAQGREVDFLNNLGAVQRWAEDACLEVTYPAPKWWMGIDNIGNIGLFDDVFGCCPYPQVWTVACSVAMSHWADRCLRYSFNTRNNMAEIATETHHRNLVGLYRRCSMHSSLEEPLNVNQLSPSEREIASLVRFDSLDFANEEWIQPLDHFECRFGQLGDGLIYLTADQQTARVIPGREGELGNTWHKLASELPAGIRVDGWS